MNRPRQNQTQCFEYQVFGVLDGSTLAPEVEVQGPFTAEQIYEVPIQGDAGLFSLRFSGGKNAPYSDRFVLWMQVEADVGTITAEVVDSSTGTVQEAIFSVPGPVVFHGTPFLVPQGSYLKLTGPGPAKVRVRWAYAASVDNYIDLACCAGGGGGGGGGGGACPPMFAPPGGISFMQGVSVVRSFAGVGFDAAATISIIDDPTGTSSGTPTLNSATVTLGGPTVGDLLTVEVDTSGATGDYLLVLTNPDGCSTSLPISALPPPP